MARKDSSSQRSLATGGFDGMRKTPRRQKSLRMMDKVAVSGDIQEPPVCVGGGERREYLPSPSGDPAEYDLARRGIER
ncbi:hypothetical protein [Thermopirellula anaerolimosa]